MNEITAIMECVRDGLSQFFSPDVTFEINGDGLCGMLKCFRPSPNRSGFLTLAFGEESVRIYAPLAKLQPYAHTLRYTYSPVHQYCHPRFPNSLLHSIALICKRQDNFERIRAETCEIALDDPKGALAYFLKEMRDDPLLGRFMMDNFSLILSFMCSGDASTTAGVTKWINDFNLTPIECYEEDILSS